MVRSFDATFGFGTVLVVVALSIAVAAVTRDDLPLVGTGVGAVIAVAVIGMAACADKAGQRSAGRILEEYQHPAAGDLTPMFKELRGLAIA